MPAIGEEEERAYAALNSAFGKEVPLTVNGQRVGTAKIVTLDLEGFRVETHIDGLAGTRPTPGAQGMSLGFTTEGN